ncbi:uncharacterized protein FIBRA_01494 [Fibroporia radiculosa]|uniref:Transcription factor domain-containing protein n=1 Tax=Fibroporia radiculosa TaxID=599839 RepID=J4I8I6_9APHY|nr:uncharacterized protein FIBRA_01494 [Fibroporia radiculosa]CCL99476.1 predicted protein [Fibroporia radiculosa]
MTLDLPQPKDAIEEGERISAFWYAFILDQIWSSASQMPPQMDTMSGVQIDTPWPLRTEDYEAGILATNMRSSRTVESFLCETIALPPHATSIVALHVQASALFGRAAFLAGRWSSSTNMDRLAAEFATLDRVIDHFIAGLAPIEICAEQDIAQMLLTHTLASVATIQLHLKMDSAEGLAESRAVAAARAAAAVLDGVSLAQLKFVDPVLAILWRTVCRVLVDEMLRLRSVYIGASMYGNQQLQYAQAERAKLLSAVNKVMVAMMSLGHTSVLMATQCAKIQQDLARVGQ